MERQRASLARFVADEQDFYFLTISFKTCGASDDYMFAVAKIPISITMELPGGGTGFDPPPSAIRRIVEESMIGIAGMAKVVAAKYND